MEEKTEGVVVETIETTATEPVPVPRATARHKFHWKVPLQTESGSTLTRSVHAFWDPNKPETKGDIELAAKIEATRELKTQCMAVGEAVLIG